MEAWERGESFPTYPQLEKLADRFKVPVAVFFFPEPPHVAPVRESFRTLSAARLDALPRRVRFLLWKATALRINLEELHGGQKPAERFILRDVRLTPEMDIPAMAAQVRAYLGVTLERQRSWTNKEVAFEAWRGVLEDHGVAVFKDTFGDEATSGFCLYHQDFPLVYVNEECMCLPNEGLRCCKYGTGFIVFIVTIDDELTTNDLLNPFQPGINTEVLAPMAGQGEYRRSHCTPDSPWPLGVGKGGLLFR